MTRTVARPFFASLALASILQPPSPAAAQDYTGRAWHPPDLVDAVASASGRIEGFDADTGA